MKAVARRRLTVLDAMILVAAAAAGFAAARAYFLGAWDSLIVNQLRVSLSSLQDEVGLRRVIQALVKERDSSHRSPSAESDRQITATDRKIAAYERRIALEKLMASYNVFLSIWTLALVGLGLRKPRPRLRRLVHEAGWAACLAATVVLVVRILSVFASWAADPSRPAPSPWPSCVAVFDDLGDYVRPSIVAVWVVIAMTGRGRLEWSSIGWLTMLTAILWVLLIFGGAAIKFLGPP